MMFKGRVKYNDPKDPCIGEVIHVYNGQYTTRFCLLLDDGSFRDVQADFCKLLPTESPPYR